MSKSAVASSAEPTKTSQSISVGDNAVDQENFKIGKVYPGDLVVYKSKHPWDWSPTYGTVVMQRPLKTLPASNSNIEQEPRKPTTTSDSAVITIEEQTTNSNSVKSSPLKGANRDQPKVTSDDAVENGPTTANHFAVHWDTSNRVRQMKRNEVCIIDRMLVRGTRVRNAEDICGTIVNYNVRSTLQIVGTNHIVQNVPLSDLSPVSSFVRGQEVLYKNWVGLITNVTRKIWFRLDGGLTFYVETMESDGFMKTDPYWGLGVACPGIRTPFSPAVLKNAKWTSRYMKFLWKWFPPISFLYSFSNATVTKVEASSVNVKWLAPAPNIKNYSEVPPPNLLDKTQMPSIQVLSMPSSEFAGLNSVRMYMLKADDQITTYGAWFSQFRHKFMDNTTSHSYSNFLAAPVTPTKPMTNVEVPVKVILRHNFVDVHWDNGKTERLASIDVPFVYEPKTYEALRSGMVVVADTYMVDSNRYGIIQQSEDLVEAGTCTVRVHWFCEGTQKNRVVQDEGTTEESIYSVVPHPRYSLFQRGTILFSNDPDLHEFNAGVVIDVDVAQGNMVIYCTDNRYRKVWPHMVNPFSKRCTWNFFTQKWIVDDIIPPPQQLGVDQYPKSKRITPREMEEVLTNLKTRNKSRLWEEPPFDILESVPDTHWYYKPEVPVVDQSISHMVKAEFDIIRGNVPDNVYIRVYESRMDLISVLILGPAKTPYEDSLLMFDLKLPKAFPKVPPQIHFISYAGEIHPLIADDGNFCEINLRWSNILEDQESQEEKSFLLEAVRSIQGLFFTREPYFADPAQNQATATTEDKEKSREYNEALLINLLGTYYQTALSPHDPWKHLVADLVLRTLPKKTAMLERWVAQSKEDDSNVVNNQPGSSQQPQFPLFPISKGFRVALENRIKSLRTILESIVQPQQPTLVPEPQPEEVPAKRVKSRSPSAILTTIEEFLHEQGREPKMVGKGAMETNEGKELNAKEESRLTLSDV